MTSVAGPQPDESLEQATADEGTTNRWVHTCTPKLKPPPVLDKKGQMKKNTKQTDSAPGLVCGY